MLLPGFAIARVPILFRVLVGFRHLSGDLSLLATFFEKNRSVSGIH